MKSLQGYNLILINIDGFRKDKVDLCKQLKSIKENSLYFSNMATVSPYTFASLHSVFSGTYPSRHGVNGYYNILKFKKNKISTLTQMLKQAGYYTCCDIISEVVLPKQGFDELNIFDEETVNFSKRHCQLIKKLAEKKPFFLFLHYTEVHKHLVRAIVQKYKQESNDDEFFNSKKENNERFNSYLPSCDEYIKNIIETLKETKIFDKTILILFADHGTSIGEKKGEKFYGVFTYDYTINVFCIVHIPGEEPKIINKQCSTIDILPTIGQFFGQYPSPKFNQVQGESLIPLIENPESPDRYVFVETGGLYGPWPSPKKHNVFCVKSIEYKLIYNDTPQTWEFYNLKNDPDELKNIYDKNLPLIKKFKDMLSYYFKENNIQINFSNS